MTFTAEDAQDDAKIKKETKSDLGRIAANQSQTIYQHFEKVCQEMNQEPREVLADMLVRALNDQDYADRISETEVTMDAISTGDYRKEDIKMVKSIAEEFGLEPDEDKQSPVDKIIESRIEAVSGGPLDRFNNNRDSNPSIDREKKHLESKINRLENELEDIKSENTEETQTEETDENNVSSSKGRKDIDELFGDDEEEEDEFGVEEDTEEEEEDDGGTDISVNVSKSMGDKEDEDDE